MSRDLNIQKPGRALLAASIIMMVSVSLSRVMGMVREMVIAGYCGTSGDVGAYQAAFLLPDILNHVLAGGFLSVTFIPMYARYLVDHREAEGDKVASLLITVTAVLAAGLGAVEWIFARDLVPLVAPGLPGPLLDEAARLTRIMIPAQLCFLPGGILMAVQMARGRFLLPALAPLVYNAAIILFGVVLVGRVGMAGFSWGVLAGACLGNLGLQAWGVRRIGFSFRLSFRLRHPDLWEYVRLTLPLALALTMTFSTEFFFKFFGSQVSPGAIACLNYALRLMLVLVALFGQAAGTASYPFLARLAAEGRMADLNALLNATLRRFLIPVICFSVLMAVLAPEIVRLVYGRGDFSPESIAPTAAALRGFLVGAFAWAGTTLVVRGWFALRNTWLPAGVSTTGVVLALPLYALFTRWWGTPGVAVGSAVAMVFQAALLYLLWNRKTGNPGARGVLAALGKTAVLAVVLGAGALGLKVGLEGVIDAGTFSGALAITLGVGAAYAGAMVLAAPLLGVREITDLVHRVLRRRK